MELQIVDAIAWVRGNAKLCFPAGVVEPVPVLYGLVGDVVVLGGGDCRILRQGTWWAVCSNVDWLVHPKFSVRELFDHVVAAPGHGDNSMRAEVLLNAFAEDVFTISGSSPLAIRGVPPPHEFVIQLHADNWSMRVVVFRLPS